MNEENLIQMCKQAYQASHECALLSTAQKNAILLDLAVMLENGKEEIMRVNAVEARDAAKKGLAPALVDRMTFNDARFKEMCDGVRKVAALDDPLNRIYDGRTLPSGLSLYKHTVPLGVVGVIFESRPNVTVDIAALCLKSGNACVLRGGSECIRTNSILHEIIEKVLKKHAVAPAAVSFVSSPDRELIGAMLRQREYISVLIPRGGEKLQRMCQEQSSIPVIIGGFGISHIFADESCDVERSVKVIVNAKVQKPSACNALDTLLVHESRAKQLIPSLLEELKPYRVEVFAHADAYKLCGDYPYLEQGKEEDFDKEFLSLRMNICIVSNVREACAHMIKHRASHSDAILTDSRANAALFIRSAGSACVYVNASTRFTDGGQFGLGAEVAISTQKLHARGPMSLEALTTYQYVLNGDYLSRA